MRSLYESLIKPYFTYGIEAWHSTSNSNLDKIFKIQKRFIRLIGNLPFNSHTSPYFKQFGILKVDDVVTFLICVRMYKAVYFEIDKDLFNYMLTHSNINSHYTRINHNIVPHFFHKTKS